MGGLAHYLEEEGIATTQISLIREHTERIAPPRALWVPFELGRPLGVPNDPDFQGRVLRAALRLLEAKSGPIIEDYAEEAPAGGEETGPWVCPVSLPPVEEAMGDLERLKAAFKSEFDQLRSWYDLSVEARGRTTVGVSSVPLEGLVDFVCAFLEGSLPENPDPQVPIQVQLNLAVTDIKAFYTEAVAAQPGRGAARSQELLDWFWDETAAGKLLLTLRDACAKSDDGLLKVVGNVLLVPASHAARKP